MGWDWLVLTHFLSRLLQRRLAAPILALRHSGFFACVVFFSPFCVLEMLQTTKYHVLWYCLDDFKAYSMQRYFGTRDFLNNVGDCSRWRSQSWHSVCPYRVKENIPVTVWFSFWRNSSCFILEQLRAREVQVWMVRELVSQELRGLEQIGCRHAFKERLLCQPQSKSAFTGRCSATAGLLTGPKVDRL